MIRMEYQQENGKKLKMICDFKSNFLKRFIDSKVKRYYLPEKFIKMLISDCKKTHNILNYSDRMFIENYISTNAVAYHNGRTESK